MALGPFVPAPTVRTHNGLHQSISHPGRDLSMTAQERDQLQQFLAALRQQRSLPKDAVAEGLIREAMAQQPDAPYWLVQRTLALQLALNTAQARMAQLEAQCDAAATASGVNRPDDGGAGAASGEAARTPAAPMAPTQSSPWGRGLLAQVSGTALGVTTGVVAGGLLLQGLQSLWGPDAASPDTAATGNLPTTALDEGDGLWDLGDDWA